jgi:hypothetical protein
MNKSRKTIHIICIITIVILVHVNSQAVTIAKMNQDQFDYFMILSAEQHNDLHTQTLVRDTIITELNRLLR